MGLLYAVGGLTKAGDSLSTVEVMDPVTGRWNPAEAMSIRRSRVGVAVLRNKLYGTRSSFSNVLFYFFETQFFIFSAIGGYNGLERLNTVEILDGSKRMWSRIGSMSCKRSAVGAAALNDRLYVTI